MKDQLGLIALIATFLLAACNTVPTPRVEQEKAAPVPVLKPVAWNELTGWADDDLRPAMEGFLQSCAVLKNRAPWQESCTRAGALQGQDADTLRQFFESRFIPHQITNADGSHEGLITGYYEPLLKGSRNPGGRYRYPLYATPDELLVIDLSEVYPELKSMRLRGRLAGRKVVPYYSRSQIAADPGLLQGSELLWVDDEVELFFLQVQGSGRVELESGEIVRVGYSEQNGHPYKSIGRALVKQGELPLEKASMQGIKTWGQANPHKLGKLLGQNSSFVFFRELPAATSGPIGALGVPLTPGRSIAVDPRAVPQGAPVFLATTWPNTDRGLSRLMVAQDTGGAIKGNVRADFFWGFGPEAGEQAGKMRQKGRMWVLLPMGYPPQGNQANQVVGRSE